MKPIAQKTFFSLLFFSLLFIMMGLGDGPSNSMKKKSDNFHDTIEASPAGFDSITGENYVYQSIEYLTNKEVYKLIDSLLDLKIIPTELIDEINLYVKAHDATSEQVLYFSDSLSSYPANGYYRIWDTYNTHPYQESLFKQDTTIALILASSEQGFVAPVVGKVTSNFGYREGRNHNGIDIDLQVWDSVVSAFDGMVRVARKHGGYGRLVVVRHFNGLESFYAHLHRIKVKTGQMVKAGELVGLGGRSGHATGSHLHFECRFKGKPLNPKSFISFKENRLIKDTILLKKTKWNYAVIPKGVRYYKIEKGDCLFDIAKKYGTSINTLCAINSISRNSVLRVGRQLRIN